MPRPDNETCSNCAYVGTVVASRQWGSAVARVFPVVSPTTWCGESSDSLPTTAGVAPLT